MEIFLVTIKILCAKHYEGTTDLCLPLITVWELHVQSVAAEEGLAVQRNLDVWGMRNGFTDEHKVGHWGLFKATIFRVFAGLMHTDVSCAVKNLQQKWW